MSLEKNSIVKLKINKPNEYIIYDLFTIKDFDNINKIYSLVNLNYSVFITLKEEEIKKYLIKIIK